MKNIIFIMISATLLFSCIKKQNENDINKIIFENEENKSATDILKLSYIKLETTDDCLIGYIERVEKYNDKLIVFDTGTSLIYIFDETGKFLGKIGNLGSGPGEYMFPYSYAIDKKSEKISIIDLNFNKLVSYSLKDFSYLSEIHFDFIFNNMLYLDDGNIALFDNSGHLASDYHIAIADSNLNIRKEYIKAAIHPVSSIGNINSFFTCNNITSFYIPYIPSIYELKKTGVEKRFEIIFKEHKFAPLDFYKVATKANRNDYVPAIKKSDYIQYFRVFENRDKICITYFVETKMYVGFFYKDSQETHLFSLEKLNNDLSVGSLKYIKGSTDDKFVAVVDPSDLLTMKENGYKFNSELQEILESSTKEDNPILVFYE